MATLATLYRDRKFVAIVGRNFCLTFRCAHRETADKGMYLRGFKRVSCWSRDGSTDRATVESWVGKAMNAQKTKRKTDKRRTRWRQTR